MEGGISIQEKKRTVGTGLKDSEEIEIREFDNCNMLKIENFSGKVSVHFGKLNKAKVSAGRSVSSAIKAAVRGEILVVFLDRDVVTDMPMSIDIELKKILL